jgi:hypothetical protein
MRLLSRLVWFSVIGVSATLLVAVVPGRDVSACHRYFGQSNCSSDVPFGPNGYPEVIGWYDMLNTASNVSWWNYMGSSIRTNALLPAIAEWEAAMTTANGFPNDGQQFSEAANGGAAEVTFTVYNGGPLPGCLGAGQVGKSCIELGTFDTTRAAWYVTASDIYINDFAHNFAQWGGWTAVISHEIGHSVAGLTDGAQRPWNTPTGLPHTVMSSMYPTGGPYTGTTDLLPGGTRVIEATDASDKPNMRTFWAPQQPQSGGFSATKISNTRIDVVWYDSSYAENEYDILIMNCSGSSTTTCDDPETDTPAYTIVAFASIGRGIAPTAHGVGSDIQDCDGGEGPPDCTSYAGWVHNRSVQQAFPPHWYLVCVAAYNYAAGRSSARCSTSTIQIT